MSSLGKEGQIELPEHSRWSLLCWALAVIWAASPYSPPLPRPAQFCTASSPSLASTSSQAPGMLLISQVCFLSRESLIRSKHTWRGSGCRVLSSKEVSSWGLFTWSVFDHQPRDTRNLCKRTKKPNKTFCNPRSTKGNRHANKQLPLSKSDGSDLGVGEGGMSSKPHSRVTGLKMQEVSLVPQKLRDQRQGRTEAVS